MHTMTLRYDGLCWQVPKFCTSSTCGRSMCGPYGRLAPAMCMRSSWAGMAYLYHLSNHPAGLEAKRTRL